MASPMWYCPCGVPPWSVCPSCLHPFTTSCSPFPLPPVPDSPHHLKRLFHYSIPQRPPRSMYSLTSMYTALFHSHSFHYKFSITLICFSIIAACTCTHSHILIDSPPLCALTDLVTALFYSKTLPHLQPSLSLVSSPLSPQGSPSTFPIHTSPLSCCAC